MTAPQAIGRAVPCVAGERWADSSAPLTADLARRAADEGVAGWIRYVGLRRPGRSDLWPVEAAIIHAAGLDLQLVQHCRMPGWTPSGQMGAGDGLAASQQAVALGCLPGVTIWCDLESVAGHCPACDVVSYCREWYAQVDGAGYLPGLYVGCACGLDAKALWRLPFTRYWASASKIPDPLPRSYCLRQGQQEMWPATRNGGSGSIYIDRDTVCGDALGGVPCAWRP